MTTMCGTYGTYKLPTDISKDVLTINFNDIVTLHEKLNNLDINHLLENHLYATQVVAGLNFKYSFSTDEHDVVVVIWKKLDNTYSVSLKSINEREKKE